MTHDNELLQPGSPARAGFARDGVQEELNQHEVSSILHWFRLDRRDFLKVAGGGLLVCAAAPAIAQESGRGGFQHELPKDLASWLHIGPDGAVTGMTGKVEVGQNIRTSLAQAIAEELRVAVAQITLIMGDTDLTPWDAGTFGSRTTPTMAPILRNVASTARELLIDTAAKRWNADRSKLVARDGRVTDPANNRSLSYGELTQGEKLTATLDADPPDTPPTEWKIEGGPYPKVNGPDFVTGRHKYPYDIERSGMMHGKILRPEGFGAQLLSLDTKAAEVMPGVKIVRDGDFVGVVAPDRYTAEKALKALKADWKVPPGPSNANLFDYLKANVGEGRGRDTRPVRSEAQDNGDFEKAYEAAPIRLERSYTVQYIAHTPLEPRVGIAEWNGDKLTVWTGTQRPFGVRDELTQAFRIGADKVRVVMPDTGSAYGGKHTGDAAVEAARLAKGAGAPVKVQWTREEEFTWAYLRPAGVIDVRSGVQKDGTIVAWSFHNYNSGPAGVEPQYEIANKDVVYHPVKSPLRQGSYRALAATGNNFARESHIDELANAVGMDPLEFRLKNLKNERVRNVLQAAAERFQWKSRKSTGDVGIGLACGTEKGGFYAACVEVNTKPQVRILRVVEAFECGAIVNPNGLINQVQGAIVMGIGGALFEAIQFANNQILNPHLNDYPVPRFRDLPDIEVVLLDRKDLPSVGAGEAPICALAPAVANAIFAATGVRVRHMPMAPDGTLREGA